MNVQPVQSNYSKKKGVEQYIKDKFNNEVYIKRDEMQIYAFNAIKRCEFAARNSNNLPFYALDSHGNQRYMISLSGFHKMITINERQVYAKTAAGSEIYPLSKARQEKLAKKNINTSELYYIRNRRGSMEYSVDIFGNQTVIRNGKNFLIALTSNNEPKAPLLKNGNIKYEKENGKEVLYIYDNKPFFGKNISGIQIYPLNEKKIPYYPIFQSKPMIAKDARGHYRYAIDPFKRKIIYPTIDGREYYITDLIPHLDYSPLEEQEQYFERYVSSNYYPSIYNSKGRTDIIIKNKLLNKYPLDTNLNEFTNDSGDIITSQGYPVSNQSFIIIPNVANTPKIKPNDVSILKHIKYLLYRPFMNTHDFLTDIKSNRKSSASKQLPYKVIDLSNYNLSIFNNEYYIIAGLSLFIVYLLLLLFIK